jgi:hypothetical protein
MAGSKLTTDARLARLERAQGQTNQHLERIDQHLERIEETLHVSSKLFELMNGRLEHLEHGQQALVEGQKLVVERLDRLVEATIRDRTHWAERIVRLEQRVDSVEERLGPASR